MKKMQKPELKVVTFDLNDVIVTSDDGSYGLCYKYSNENGNLCNPQNCFTVGSSIGRGNCGEFKSCTAWDGITSCVVND